MSQDLNGGVNIYINEEQLTAQILRLQKQADGLSKSIASGSIAAKETEDALKKMGDKESDLKRLRDAAAILEKEIEQVGKAGGNTTQLIKDLGTTTATINKVEREVASLKNGIEATTKNQKDLNTNMAKLAEVRDKIAIVEKQMRGELAPSVKQAGDAVRKLYNELQNLSKDAPEYADKLSQFDKANAVFTRMKSEVGSVGKVYESIVSQIKSVSIGVLIGNTVTAMAERVLAAGSALFKLRNEFESSIANLRAITGATGEDLDFLKNKAIELSLSTSNSAKDYVEAFKLIASAKPELLQDRDGLVEVAEAASLLSRAAGIELPDASTRLTDALNQYGAPASEAKKYVDALAAAAKFGAAEVPQVTEALLQFGTAAKSSNVSIYESAGAIELLAEKGQKGADAGTKLRNVLINLNSSKGLDDKAINSLKAYGVNLDLLTDSTKSFEVRLTELGKIQNDTTALLNVFGKENINAAQILLQNIPRYAQLTAQIKSTGVASEQAGANTKTFSSAMAQLSNTFNALLLQGLDNSGLSEFIQGISRLLKSIYDLNDVQKTQTQVLEENRVGLNLNLNALQSSNLSAEARKRLIQETNEKYGEYLPNLLTEKSTLEDIRSIQEESNKLIQLKIYAMAYEKEITAILKAQFAAQEDNYNREIEREKLRADVKTGYSPSQIQSINKFSEAIQKANDFTIKNTDRSVAEVESKYRTMLERLGVKWEDFMKMLGGQKSTPNSITQTSLTLDPDADKKRQKELDDMKRFMEELARLRNENSLLDMDENAKAIVAARDKYEHLYEFAVQHFGANGKITQELEKFYADEVNRANDKASEKGFKASYAARLQLATNFYKELRTAAEGDKELQISIDVAEYQAKANIANEFKTVVKDAENDRIKFTEQAGLKRVELEKEIQRRIKEARDIKDRVDLNVATITKDLDAETQARLNALDHRYADEQERFKKNEQVLNDLAREYNAQRQAILDQADQTRVSKATAYYQKFSETLTNLITTITSLQNAADEAELSRFKRNNDAAKASLEKRHTAGKISTEEYNKELAALDEEYRAKEREIKTREWERNRDAQMIAAISTGITTVLNAYNSGVQAGGPAGLAVGALYAALAGAFVAFQVGALAAQPTPEFEKGGIANGPTHAQGGIAMVDSSTGRKVGEMEGGEAYMILSRNTTRNNGRIINALLHSSMYNNGAPVDWSAATAHPRFELGGVMDTMQMVKFANGGIFTPPSTAMSTQDQQMLNLLNDIAYSLRKPQRNYVLYEDVTDRGTRLTNAQNRATIRN